MARVLIRNPLNNGWLKLEDLDAYVRSPENDKWLKLYPYNFSLRNSANTGWDEVTDIFFLYLVNGRFRLSVIRYMEHRKEILFLAWVYHHRRMKI